MKTYKRTSLPDSVEVAGTELKVNIEVSHSMNQNGTHPNKIAKELRKQGRKCALVLVLSNNLKGRTDLHGKLYEPSRWVFTN